MEVSIRLLIIESALCACATQHALNICEIHSQMLLDVDKRMQWTYGRT